MPDEADLNADCMRCGGDVEIKGRWCIPCYDVLVAAHARQFVRTHIDGTVGDA